MKKEILDELERLTNSVIVESAPTIFTEGTLDYWLKELEPYEGQFLWSIAPNGGVSLATMDVAEGIAKVRDDEHWRYMLSARLKEGEKTFRRAEGTLFYHCAGGSIKQITEREYNAIEMEYLKTCFDAAHKLFPLVTLDKRIEVKFLCPRSFIKVQCKKGNNSPLSFIKDFRDTRKRLATNHVIVVYAIRHNFHVVELVVGERCGYFDIIYNEPEQKWEKK